MAGPSTLGLVPSRSTSARGRGTFRRRGGGPNNRSARGIATGPSGAEANAASQAEQRLATAREHDAIDERMGFQRLDQGEARQGWMVNMHPTLLPDDTHPGGRSGVDYYLSLIHISEPTRPY